MSDEQEVLESKASPEAQAKAEEMGWQPPTRYKGDPERFVDADEYLKRGEEILPIIKKTNERLREELTQLRGKYGTVEAALRQAQTAIEEINERHSVDTQKAVEAARREVKAQLTAASAAGDHESVAELTDQLTQLNAAEKPKADDKAAPAAKPATFEPPADLLEWTRDEAPWFGKDKRRTSLALGIAQELREAGDTSQGVEFYRKVGKEVEKTLSPRTTPDFDKVEAGRSGGEGEPRTGGKKTYAHLPADAKAACDADIRKFVGEGKRYKDAAAWRSRFAELYFSQEA